MSIKRFYKTAGVAAANGGFAVTLDGRPVRTPMGAPLQVPSAALAEALAAEWQDQGEQIEPASMPLTQLANTAIDRVGPLRGAVIDELLNYAGTDLLCYRAEHPAELATRQSGRWQPVLDWAMTRFDAPLLVVTGVMPVAQPAETLAALRRAAEAYEPYRLTALQMATAASGSLVLALALVEGRLDEAEAFAASQLDELYQAELWGEDEEAAARRDRLKTELTAAAAFARLAG